ncbi:MAG: hypothetical protein ACLUOI_33330 [Eisenbergiella sp.]
MPLSTVKTSGSREAEDRTACFVLEGNDARLMMHMAITMIKLVFCPYRSPTRPLMVE